MKVGIIGAGTMGSGIAQAFAIVDGYEVFLCDILEEYAKLGKEKIISQLNRSVEKGKITREQAEKVPHRIHTGTIEICSGCDLIVEAASEDIDIKKKTFQELDKICGEKTIFATNTSSLSITEIASQISRPLVGMHFFNPAPIMKLVEVIAGLNTPEAVTKRVIEIASSIGKVPIQVEEAGGFVVNRLLIPMINEAIAIFAEGIASAKDIDAAMKLGANHPMGPLELGDLIGLDIVLAIMEVLLYETKDPKYRPHPLLRKMVRGKRFGQKTKIGFYTY